MTSQIYFYVNSLSESMYNHNIHGEKVILFICLDIKNIIMQSNNPSWQSESFFFKKNRYIKKEFKKSSNPALMWLLCFAGWHWFIPAHTVICKFISWSMPGRLCLYTLWKVVSAFAFVQAGLLKKSDCLYFAGNRKRGCCSFFCFI